MSPRSRLLAAALAALASSPAWSQADSGALYRCPGNDYRNTLTPSEAEKLNCKRVENAAVTVIRSPVAPGSSAPAGTPVPPAPSPAAEARLAPENAALRDRASDTRRQLEGRLRSEERRLSEMEKEFNGGDPDRRQDETNLQTYLDRVARMRTEIARKQIDIAELRRELDKLPTATR